MDNKSVFKELSQISYEQQLSSIKETIKEYLSNCGDKVNISCLTNWGIECLKLRKNSEYVPSFISIKEGVMNLTRLDDELIDFIMANIPSNVRDLTLPFDIVKKHMDVFRKFPNLEVVGISDCGFITFEELKYLTANTRLKEVNMPYIDILKMDEDSNISYYCDSTTEIKLGDINVKSNAEFSNSIIINDFSNLDFIDKIPKEFISGRYSTIYKGNEIARVTPDEISILMGDNTDNMISVVYKLLDKMDNKPKKIKLMGENKTYDNMETIRELNETIPVYISYGSSTTAPLDEFENMRGTLDYFKGLILQNDLSPAEKVCYAYDLIKSHLYKESETSRSESRNIHSIVSTGNIVCVGYAVFFAQLLKECGITAHAIGTKVPLKNGEIAGHERNIVEIDDDKYDIHGVFAFDPTWDSNYRYSVVNRDGEIRPVYEPEETDEVVGLMDPMSSYTFFFIPASQYGLYFFDEEQHEKIGDWRQETYDPNAAAPLNLSEAIKSNRQSTVLYDSEEAIDEDVILDLIKNTRSMEGYSETANEELMKEVELIRRRIRPKELRAEDGMRL